MSPRSSDSLHQGKGGVVAGWTPFVGHDSLLCAIGAVHNAAGIVVVRPAKRERCVCQEERSAVLSCPEHAKDPTKSVVQG